MAGKLPEQEQSRAGKLPEQKWHPSPGGCSSAPSPCPAPLQFPSPMLRCLIRCKEVAFPLARSPKDAFPSVSFPALASSWNAGPALCASGTPAHTLLLSPKNGVFPPAVPSLVGFFSSEVAGAVKWEFQVMSCSQRISEHLLRAEGRADPCSHHCSSFPLLVSSFFLLEFFLAFSKP